MVNIVRRSDVDQGRQLARTEWDPLRMMRDLFRWDPFAEMMPLLPTTERGTMFVPQFEVKEMNDRFVFKADVPGVKEEDLEIALTGNRLTISGKREEEERTEEQSYFAYERSYGSFTRSFTLPEGIDTENVKADLRGGVLTLVLSKRPELQPKRIPIQGEAKKVKA